MIAYIDFFELFISIFFFKHIILPWFVVMLELLA